MAPSVPPLRASRYHRIRRILAVGAVGGTLVVGCSTDRPAGDAALTASTLVDDAASPGSLTATTQGSDAGVPPEPTVSTDGTTTTAAASSASSESGSGSGSTGAGADGATPAPEWIGQRTLPTTPVGRVVPQTTPEELVGRRFVTVDLLAPPDDDTFVADIAAVDADTLARSTWEPGCPVEPEELSYLTMTFWGFDGKPHTGEMLVNAEVASDIVAVFERLFDARFPIEEMRIVTRADLDAPPTGDGNNTTAFVCRPVTGGTSFSEHAFGLAIDINPFHNPYQRNDLVLPELATYYLDRQLGQPGMVVSGDVVVEAFASIGWPWGGDWTSLKDYQHFSRSGR